MVSKVKSKVRIGPPRSGPSLDRSAHDGVGARVFAFPGAKSRVFDVVGEGEGPSRSRDGVESVENGAGTRREGPRGGSRAWEKEARQKGGPMGGCHVAGGAAGHSRGGLGSPHIRLHHRRTRGGRPEPQGGGRGDTRRSWTATLRCQERAHALQHRMEGRRCCGSHAGHHPRAGTEAAGHPTCQASRPEDGKPAIGRGGVGRCADGGHRQSHRRRGGRRQGRARGPRRGERQLASCPRRIARGTQQIPARMKEAGRREHVPLLNVASGKHAASGPVKASIEEELLDTQPSREYSSCGQGCTAACRARVGDQTKMQPSRSTLHQVWPHLVNPCCWGIAKTGQTRLYHASIHVLAF
eukprot:scaffold47_cov334-Pavlova_lutheri.AAC.43